MNLMVSISERIDLAVTIFFSLEALMKIIALGFFMEKGSYLRDNWQVLDFVIVVSSLLDYIL